MVRKTTKKKPVRKTATKKKPTGAKGLTLEKALSEAELLEQHDQHSGKQRNVKTYVREKDLYSEEELAQIKELFLYHFEEYGRVDLATKKIGVHYSRPYYWARVDEDFKAKWDAAKEVAVGHIEDIAYRRAVNGTLKPVYQQGVLVGTVREYSDMLTVTLLKGLKPHVYRERVDIESSGKKGGEPIKHEHSVGLSDELAEQMKRKFLGVKEENEE